MEEYIAAKEQVVHNIGNKPTFVGKTLETHLDITLSDQKAAEKSVLRYILFEIWSKNKKPSRNLPAGTD